MGAEAMLRLHMQAGEVAGKGLAKAAWEGAEAPGWVSAGLPHGEARLVPSRGASVDAEVAAKGLSRAR